ncbi:MAG: hypothetical protein AB8B72_03770, partial [Crocinitomicaceae bacterium]
MQKTGLSVILMLFIACTNQQNKTEISADKAVEAEVNLNNDSDAMDISAAQDAVSETESAIINPELFNPVDPGTFANNKTLIYIAKIGQYQSQGFVDLTFKEESVSGSYHYSQYQKDLQLSGKVNYETGEIELEEAYKGKKSGYFKGILTESTITGKWSAKPDFQNRSDFSMQVVDVNPEALRTDKGRFKKYKHSYESGLYNSETDEYDPYLTEDVIKVSFIDDRHFGFVYDISGMNGHSGTISGLAALGDSAKWYFSGQAECELKFNFIADTIKIEAQGCEDYSGFRAHFGGALTLYK